LGIPKEPVLVATCFIRQVFWDFWPEFRLTISPFPSKVVSVYSMNMHWDFLAIIFRKNIQIISSKTQFDIHILNINKYFSPLFV